MDDTQKLKAIASLLLEGRSMTWLGTEYFVLPMDRLRQVLQELLPEFQERNDAP